MKLSIRKAITLCVIFSVVLFIIEADILFPSSTTTTTSTSEYNNIILDEDAILNNRVPGEDIFYTIDKSTTNIKKEDTFYFKFTNNLDTIPQTSFSSKCKGIDDKFYYTLGKPFYEGQEPTLEIYYDTKWDMRNHIDDIKENNSPITKVLLTLEPPHLRLCAFDKDCVKKFNWAVSYEQVAEVKVGYFAPEKSPFDHYHLVTKESITTKLDKFKEEYDQKKAKGLLEPHQLSGVPLASWFCSNCEITKSNREKYVQELMKHIPIDSFGKCLNNMPFTSKELGREANDYPTAKNNKISSYKFNIAFENSNCIDYITEKPLDALQFGTVPIYLGHPQTLKYFPDGSYIFVGDFKTPKELAEYLLYLDQNDEEYFKYHEWRSNPETIKKWHKVNNFPNKASNNINYFMCQLLRRYQYLQNGTIPHKNLKYIPYSEKCLPQDYFI